MTSNDHDLDPDRLLLIVVGAHLAAERADRPLAGRLGELIRRWQGERRIDEPVPLTCTDLWFVNHAELLARPAISIGAPEVNAASAYLATRLPTALVVEDSLRVQLDPEHVGPRVCLWGVDHAATAAAVDVFVERYLDAYLEQVCGEGVM